MTPFLDYRYRNSSIFWSNDTLIDFHSKRRHIIGWVTKINLLFPGYLTYFINKKRLSYTYKYYRIGSTFFLHIFAFQYAITLINCIKTSLIRRSTFKFRQYYSKFKITHYKFKKIYQIKQNHTIVFQQTIKS